MINYTVRLDKALRKAAWAHEQAEQYRKGSDIPYIIHPVGTMMIASNVTDDEDILIACLLHDVLEDVDSTIYSEADMREDFGDRVVAIVKDVTKDGTKGDWRERAQTYLEHLEHSASDEAVIVSAADKTHNLLSILSDYAEVGDELWNRFSTKSGADQLWWYNAVLGVATRRGAPQRLVDDFSKFVNELQEKLAK